MKIWLFAISSGTGFKMYNLILSYRGIYYMGILDTLKS